MSQLGVKPCDQVQALELKEESHVAVSRDLLKVQMGHALDSHLIHLFLLISGEETAKNEITFRKSMVSYMSLGP